MSQESVVKAVVYELEFFNRCKCERAPSSDANGNFVYIYYYVLYVVPHILNLSNLTHVTSIKYV